ncbi:MAG TPA: sugar porter family MFS transporter [Acidobacteriota bacterium]|nr:sugar porter family MFS transporter [Acidobacteriota bacterium]
MRASQSTGGFSMPLAREASNRGVETAADTGSMVFVYLVSLVAAVGGLLFGFDTAVISGAIGFMKAQFHLDASQEGFVASSALIGCVLGAFVAGAMSDRFGRKRVLFLSGVFFAISALGAALPRNMTEFVIARIIGGLGIGAASLVSPLYIAELAPAKRRGGLVSLNQLAIISGILVAYLVDWLCARGFGPETSWRWMFGSGAAPAFLLMGLLVLVPESPRWLTKQGRPEEALEILRRIGGRNHADVEMREIQDAIQLEGGSLMQLLQPGLRIALLIAVVLAILQQVTGINTVIYYAPRIFENARFARDAALLSSVIVGIVNAVFTVVAILQIDRIGRKPLLMIGAAGMGVSFALAGCAFQVHATGIWVLTFILVYIASFAVALGPVVWVVISEIFPTRIRGRAMGIATVCLWIACYLVSLTFPILVDHFGDSFTFWLYGFMCAVAFVFVWRVVPETKGRTLEEIEQSWLHR